MHKFEDVTRVEVIGDGREYVSGLGLEGAEISIQDGGRTMKVFIKRPASPRVQYEGHD